MTARKLSPPKRQTGDLVTAAIWNDDAANNTLRFSDRGIESVAGSSSSAADILKGLAPDDLVQHVYQPSISVPFAFPKETLIECQYCGQINMAQHNKLYAGCGACGGPFDVAQFHQVTPSTKIKILSTDPRIQTNYDPLMQGTNNADGSFTPDEYWVFGASQDYEIGDVVSVGF